MSKASCFLGSCFSDSFFISKHVAHHRKEANKLISEEELESIISRVEEIWIMWAWKIIESKFLYSLDELDLIITNISSIKIETFKKGYCLKKEETKDVLRIIVEGELERYYKDKHIHTLARGDYFGGLSRALKRESIFDFQVKKRLKTYKIPFDALEDIPIIRWKMFEKNEILKQKVNF